MTTLAVNAFGLLLLAAVVWWFWLAGRRRSVSANGGRIAIRVADGVYDPDRIALRAGETVEFEFNRVDPTPCAEIVQFEGLEISRELPVGKPTTLAIRYEEPGEYAFTCQMGMYRGSVVVE